MIVEDGEVMDPLAEIGYTDAVKIEPDFEVGKNCTKRWIFSISAAAPFLQQNKHLPAVSAISRKMCL